MNLRHVEIFHAVYVHGSVSNAARALNVSQPSVTKMLRHAESLLGFDLFTRTKGRLVPTEDAHQLFSEASAIQERVQSLRDTSRNLRRGAGTLRISALPSLALGVLPSAVARVLKRTPGVSFDLQTVHHDDLLRKLYERECDVAIAYEVPVAAPIAAHALGEGELVVLYRESDLPDAPARLDLAALTDRPFISLARSGPLGQMFSAECDRLGVAFDEVVSTRTFYIAAALVRAGVGIAVVDSFTAAASLSAGLAFRPLRPAITFDVHAMFLENRPPSTLALSFLDELRASIDVL
ncbi:LysR family transcriptional regulator [Sphingomonas qomolangmaensis]|uniref:LysR family transcriptional regulator n=1 Tax=Sphingomonas qomolangmaensis TaxID=2918765 RepID=A0ABY5L431_9SPHN|nr:LysR family transcriptional regulator [Sphingomonas qomolangmaensis]UUL81718.1 LysR family transcriptional regulator [Sphingomonas qomolangmaensis]